MIKGMTGKLIENSQKELVLKEMIDQCLIETSADFREEVFKKCLGRESEATTVVEKGLAFPHAKMVTEIKPTVCIGYSREGIVWDSSGEVVNIIVLLICHEDDHLAILAELASMIQVPGVLEKLETADSPEAIIQILENAREFRPQKVSLEKKRLTHAMVEHLCMLMNSSGKTRVVLLTNTPERISELMKKLESTRISLVTNKKDLKNQVVIFGSKIESIFQVDGDLSDEKSILRELWRNEGLKEGEIIISLTGYLSALFPGTFTMKAVF
jgi:mannitol/fructose-specific phosphotransferase system IIA component (Ntr-type)